MPFITEPRTAITVRTKSRKDGRSKLKTASSGLIQNRKDTRAEGKEQGKNKARGGGDETGNHDSSSQSDSRRRRLAKMRVEIWKSKRKKRRIVKSAEREAGPQESSESAKYSNGKIEAAAIAKWPKPENPSDPSLVRWAGRILPALHKALC